MAYVSSSGDIATSSWMLRPVWPGRGSGVPGWDSPPEGSSEGALILEDCEASGSPERPLMDSSVELRGDSGAGLQLADVLGVPSVQVENKKISRRLGEVFPRELRFIFASCWVWKRRNFSQTTSANLTSVKQTAKVLKFSYWSFFGSLHQFLHLPACVCVTLLCSSAGWKRAVTRSCQCTLAAVYTPREKERHTCTHAHTHTYIRRAAIWRCNTNLSMTWQTSSLLADTSAALGEWWKEKGETGVTWNAGVGWWVVVVVCVCVFVFVVVTESTNKPLALIRLCK